MVTRCGFPRKNYLNDQKRKGSALHNSMTFITFHCYNYNNNYYTQYTKPLYCTSSITKKNIRFDFDGEIKIRHVRYKHLTKITIKGTTLLTFTI